MQNTELYKKPEKQVIDISTWSRRGNFEFFRDFYNPNLGVTVRVDVRHAYSAAKAKGVSFFLSYFYAILSAANEIREFRYRFDQEGNVVCYDRIDGLRRSVWKKRITLPKWFFRTQKTLTRSVRQRSR